MAGLWKRDGTVAVTSGSKKVTGTGTTFADAKNGVAKGHLFCMTTGATVDLYEVDYVVSNTELFLVQAFRGVTGTGKAYEVITTFSDSIPEFARKLNASLSYYQGQSDMVQQLFTSDAAEITVTAPDGTTHKLIPWKRVTSDGEGQAARSKVEADRSRDEANRSKDEADKAAGIVAAAALPLPDVWAPLSDSLRMITGYGRDVLVGADVVARMVNFSRNSVATYIGKDGQLKTAVANEPQFEKEGLLLDGQSTNLVPKSEDLLTWAKNGAITVEKQPGVYTKITPALGTSGCYLSGITLVVGRVYTISFWGYGDAEVSTTIGIEREPSGRVAKLTTTPTRFSRTFTASQASGTIVAYSYFPDGPTTNFYVGGFQLEELPFASSYIPTAGAAAARAAVLATLPQSLNLGESQLGFSFAVEFDSVNTGAGRLLELSDLSTILTDGASVIIRHAGKEVYGANAPLGQRHHLAYSVAADGAITAALNGKLLALQTRSAGSNSSKSVISLGNLSNGSGGRPLYGHLRDLKIWTKKPLTADQLKVASA
ncbi:hypothetical protein H9X88_11980 [Aeromonas hydrophila]|uniref:phage head spike fiber domain-containing protein n=1 Tax=Aeromonas hydrophila TaxID=644 RepID=UPI001B39D3E3|nr:hypothetical protein [Aeromonas hydrophila]MBQ4676982.1 hypothetical protein [Aeromonas hydrophila]MBW3813585.1 hypothetical protein [Aeromonas hydrophila]MCF7678816.1 hypothetical protein [Aeromonas hydrophila]MCF7691864.1 hypothetical protein [Aeromonas hydrophila]MCF7772664.1 hypothetical protein [Aeromonas hydrophila]